MPSRPTQKDVGAALARLKDHDHDSATLVERYIQALEHDLKLGEKNDPLRRLIERSLDPRWDRMVDAIEQYAGRLKADTESRDRSEAAQTERAEALKLTIVKWLGSLGTGLGVGAGGTWWSLGG